MNLGSSKIYKFLITNSSPRVCIHLSERALREMDWVRFATSWFHNKLNVKYLLLSIIISRPLLFIHWICSSSYSTPRSQWQLWSLRMAFGLGFITAPTRFLYYQGLVYSFVCLKVCFSVHSISIPTLFLPIPRLNPVIMVIPSICGSKMLNRSRCHFGRPVYLGSSVGRRVARRLSISVVK